MQGIQHILQFEAKLGALNAKPLGDQLQTFLNATSQYELLRMIYSQNLHLGNSIVEEHVNKHPLAMESQRILFAAQPGILPFLMSITLDREHPLKNLDEYLKVIQLINHEYPKITSTEEQVKSWSSALEIALIRFLDCSLICASYAIDFKTMNLREPKLLLRLDPFMFNPNLTVSPQMMCALRSVSQQANFMGNTLRTLGNIRVHGVLTPEQEEVLVDMIKTYVYFLTRKLTILGNIVVHPQFTIGLFNVVTKISECPPVCIAFGYNGDPKKNVPNVGVEFNELVPMACVSNECHRKMACEHLTNTLKHVFIRVASVELGDPPLGAQRTVNFGAMKTAWAQKALIFNCHVPSFDPMEKPPKRKYRKKRGTLVENKMVWEDKYLRHVVREFKKKNEEDDFMMKAHLYVKSEITDGGVQEIASYKLDTAPKLFMPGLHQAL